MCLAITLGVRWGKRLAVDLIPKSRLTKVDLVNQILHLDCNEGHKVLDWLETKSAVS